MFFNHRINELIQRQQRWEDSIRTPIETASLVAEKLNGISLHFNNSLFETIQKQQTILSEISLPTVQVSLMSVRLEQISSLFTQEISLINKEIPLRFANVLEDIDSYNFQDSVKPVQDTVRNIVTN